MTIDAHSQRTVHGSLGLRARVGCPGPRGTRFHSSGIVGCLAPSTSHARPEGPVAATIPRVMGMNRSSGLDPSVSSPYAPVARLACA